MKAKEIITFKGKKVVGGKAEGKALVSNEPICFLGGVNIDSGIISEKGHQLEGKTIKDRILIFPVGKGSTGGAYLIYATAKNGYGPKAIINIKPDPITVVGSILSEIPMVVGVDPDFLNIVKDDDLVFVDADIGTITIRKITQ